MTAPPPAPPGDLASRDPLMLTIRSGAVLHRMFNASFDPVFYDRSLAGRLNSPDGSYGVMYVAKDLAGAFAETFLRNPGLARLPAGYLGTRGYATLASTRDLRLVKLSGPGLARLGATAQVSHGGWPYGPYQEWSKAIEAHPTAADGIAYTARHDDEQLCYALFERSAPAIVVKSAVRDLDQDWFWTLANTYGLSAPIP